MNSRDEFIAAMIAELEKQKASQGNQEQFYTGGYLNAGDVFRKLCYDYPIIDDQALQIFLVGLKTIRASNKPHELRKSFQLNSKFLDNISYLIHDLEHAAHDGTKQNNDNSSKQVVDSDEEEGTEKQPISLKTTNNGKAVAPAVGVSAAPPIPCKRSTILGQLSSEIFLRFPLFLSKLTKSELSSFLCDDLTHIHNPQLPKVIVTDIDWRDLLSKYREFIIKGHSNIICHGNDSKSLSSNGILDDVISLVAALKTIVDHDSEIPVSHTKDVNSPMLKHSAHMNVIEYLESQRNLLRNRKQSAAHEVATTMPTDGEDDGGYDLAEQLVAITKEIWTHLVYQVVDIVCRYLELVPLYLPKLLDVLLIGQQSPNGSETTNGTTLNPSVFFNNVNVGKGQQQLPKMPSPSEYLALMVLSNMSNFIAKEEELILERGTSKLPLLRSARECLRKYLTTRDTLKSLHDLCETIRTYNTHGVEKSMYTIDLESAFFVLDLVDLVVMDGESTGSNAQTTNAIIQKLMSSRLLASLMAIYRNIFYNYKSFNSEINNQAAQVWLLTCRSTKALVCIALMDANAAQFIAEFPEVVRMLPEFFVYPPIAQNYALWCPTFSLPLAFALSIVLHESTNSVIPTLNQSLNFLATSIDALDWTALRSDKDDADVETDGVLTENESSSSSLSTDREAESHQKRQQQQQLRFLESLIFSVKLLHRESIKTYMNKIEFDQRKAKQRTELFTTLRINIARIYRSINRGRGLVAERSDLSNSVIVSYYDKAGKQLKALMSLLEGGVSSKTD